MDIGQAILEIRKEKGLKQEAVALIVNTDSGYLSRIESGSRKPSLPMLEKIATAMGVTVTLIVAKAEGISLADRQMLEQNWNDISEEAIQLRQQFRTLTPENQRALLEITKVLNRLQRNT
jgi:transcriptional regulator with XRE-family HTH domain